MQKAIPKLLFDFDQLLLKLFKNLYLGPPRGRGRRPIRLSALRVDEVIVENCFCIFRSISSMLMFNCFFVALYFSNKNTNNAD
jgi:hypothetical protein